jgi:hypothetical protein
MTETPAVCDKCDQVEGWIADGNPAVVSQSTYRWRVHDPNLCELAQIRKLLQALKDKLS